MVEKHNTLYTCVKFSNNKFQSFETIYKFNEAILYLFFSVCVTDNRDK